MQCKLSFNGLTLLLNEKWLIKQKCNYDVFIDFQVLLHAKVSSVGFV